MLKRILFAVVALSFCSTSAFAQDVFVSFGSALDGDTLSDSATAEAGTSGTGFVYVNGDFAFDGFQVDLSSSNTAVATVTSGFVINSFSQAAGTRFNNADVDLNSNGEVDGAETGDINSIPAISTPTGITYQALSINQNGLVTGLFSQFDQGFVADIGPTGAGLFQLGSFEYDVVGAGDTEFTLTTTTSDVFAGPTGFLTIPEGESVSPTFAAATLSVTGDGPVPGVPEPSALGLLAFGLVGFVARRRR